MAAPKTYWKNCSVCQLMKKNRDFRTRIRMSSYFSPSGTESPMKVNKDFGSPFKQGLLYAHLKRHQGHEVVRAASHINEEGQLVIDKRMKPTFEVIEAVPGGTSNAELGLDDFIAMGRDKLAQGELTITSSSYLTAIKAKLDNDAKTKDRRADMLQGLFKGAAPKQDV